MKKILVNRENENNLHLRANLHCHSTISDGNKTPLQLRDDYKAHGYQILCITDHEIFLPHNDLSQDDFLMLNGFEISVDEPNSVVSRCCHLCMIADNKEETVQPCYHRTKYLWGNAVNYKDKIVYDESKPDFEKEYTPECINKIIEECRNSGFFVTYNHPTWSMENYPFYSKYKGMNAMEMVNFSCIISGYDDDNGHTYNDILDNGQRIFAIASDDDHNRVDDENPKCDSYGGYTVIQAPKLAYEEVMNSLKEGNFYCATGNHKQKGPEIKFLEIDGNNIRIETSNVHQINLITDKCFADSKVAPEGENINFAEFEISDWIDWFRLTVVDDRGFKAYTNAYFVK